MNLNEFFYSLTLPKKYFDNNFVMSEKFNQEKRIFLDNFKSYFPNEYSTDKNLKIKESFDQIEDDIKRNFDTVSRAFECYDKSNPAGAQIEFDILMDDIKNDIFITNIHDQKIDDASITSLHTGNSALKSLFRIRSVEYPSETIKNNPLEMFHIPFSKRDLVGAGRYNVPGSPALYLSTSLTLAWQEMGYPKKYYYSEFQYKRNLEKNYEYIHNLKLIALYSPQEISRCNSLIYNDINCWLNIATSYLKTYPLILACSFVNKRKQANFKQEYIMPQLLMQWIYRNHKTIQGVSYFTCVDTKAANGGYSGYNIAIPAVKDTEHEEHSKYLKDTFSWASAECYSIPIIDKQQNQTERRIISDFIDLLHKTLRSNMPFSYHSAIYEMLKITTNFQSFLNHGENADMELLLNMMQAINNNFYYFKSKKLEQYIEDANKESCSGDFKALTKEFEEIHHNFTDTVHSGKGIGKIIEHSTYHIWNNMHNKLALSVLFTDETSIKDTLKYFQDNHILYSHSRLDDNNFLEKLNEICVENDDVTLKSFWDDCIDAKIFNDEWMKDNLAKIKQPIIIKHNDQSIISKPNLKTVELISIGFDKEKIENFMNKDCADVI